MISFYLAIKEVWRNKSRFLLFSMVIALITTLVLFIAGLAEGLATANREYLAKLDGELVVFQENVDLSTITSRISESTLSNVRRVPGVAEVGPVGFSNATIDFSDGREDVDVSLIGFEPGYPGGAPAFTGRNVVNRLAEETVIDGKMAQSAGIQVGDIITIKSIQGTDEEYFDLKVAGITDGRQYFFQPSIFVPLEVWDEIRPQAISGMAGSEIAYNILAVQLDDPAALESMAAAIQTQVEDVEVTDVVTAYEATPGYAAQQSTLNTQRGFTLLIGILVIGGFFQIQTLQKIPNIGMLKAIGTGNRTVGGAVVLQILAVTVFGVLLGAAFTLALSLGLPEGIPIVFTGQAAAAAILSLILIGPLGGLVSVWMAVKAEPLMALGLSS
jgi:putative ABC transport system permease protein